jgi:hypothetical protein
MPLLKICRCRYVLIVPAYKYVTEYNTEVLNMLLVDAVPANMAVGGDDS